MEGLALVPCELRGARSLTSDYVNRHIGHPKQIGHMIGILVLLAAILDFNIVAILHILFGEFARFLQCFETKFGIKPSLDMH